MAMFKLTIFLSFFRWSPPPPQFTGGHWRLSVVNKIKLIVSIRFVFDHPIIIIIFIIIHVKITQSSASLPPIIITIYHTCCSSCLVADLIMVSLSLPHSIWAPT